MLTKEQLHLEIGQPSARTSYFIVKNTSEMWLRQLWRIKFETASLKTAFKYRC